MAELSWVCWRLYALCCQQGHGAVSGHLAMVIPQYVVAGGERLGLVCRLCGLLVVVDVMRACHVVAQPQNLPTCSQ